MADTVGGLYCQWGHTQHYGYFWPTPLGRVSGDRMTHLHVPGAQLEISHVYVVSGVGREGRGVGCGCLWWDGWSRELRGLFWVCFLIWLDQATDLLIWLDLA